MSADKYLSIFSRQMEAIVYIASSQRDKKIPRIAINGHIFSYHQDEKNAKLIGYSSCLVLYLITGYFPEPTGTCCFDSFNNFIDWHKIYSFTNAAFFHSCFRVTRKNLRDGAKITFMLDLAQLTCRHPSPIIRWLLKKKNVFLPK